MKLNTRKYLSLFTFFLMVCFIVVSFFGIHSRWGDTVHNHFKGWENLKFGQDFENHTAMIFKTSDNNSKLNDENLIKTINNRLQNIGCTDNKITVDTNNSLMLEFTQPAGIPEFDQQTIANLICFRGDLLIKSSNATNETKNAIIINNKNIDNVEVISRKIKNIHAKPDYGLKIQLNHNGTKKLATLTHQIVIENEKLKQQNQNNPNSSQNFAKLSIMLDQNDLTNSKTNNFQSESGLDVTEPITDGQIEIFNGANIHDSKIIAAILNEKPISYPIYMEKLKKMSPNLGMWFKRITYYSILLIMTIIILILILKFKLIGIICATCLVGHLSFILASFTGFFEIYPGNIFNFAALVGTTVSTLFGINACFLIGKKTKSNLKTENNENYITNIKNGLNYSMKIVKMWNYMLIIFALIAMAMFSYKTNAVTFLLKPLYKLMNLMDLNLVYDNSIASLSYAIFVGSLGSLLFEVFLLKFLATSVTSPKININFQKCFNSLKTIKTKLNFKFNFKKFKSLKNIKNKKS